MLGVPNYHLKKTLSTFGGSIFSGTQLKVKTPKWKQMCERYMDVELVHSTLIFVSIFCFSVVLSRHVRPVCESYYFHKLYFVSGHNGSMLGRRHCGAVHT